MSERVFKVRSEDGSTPQLIEQLAQQLGEDGSVYAPHYPIPPEARMAPPPPKDAMLVFDSARSSAAVAEAMRRHLQRGKGRTIVLEEGDRRLTLTAESDVERELVDWLEHPQ